ncbi:MAG: twin-arginine translocase subunit TatC [Candidatus Omnitrophica bacterium]|nr:twin-arginine translocase subunit TatC [Candidatus Omnitrophota bacterium]
MEIEKRLTLIEHLEELRRRIITCLAVVLITSLIAYVRVKEILESLVKPLGNTIFISPAEVFVVYIKVAFFCGIILASPVILFQLWQFVGVALTPTERRYIVLVVPASVILFFLGGIFAYFMIIPLGVKFLLGFATEYVVPMISINKYVNFIGILMLATGVIFELPLVILFLNGIGLVSPKSLRQNYKFVIVLMLIIAAIITPTPDIFTQLLVSIPMILLYEVSIWLAHLSNILRGKT